MGQIDVSVSLTDIADAISWSMRGLNYEDLKDFILLIDAAVADTSFTEDLVFHLTLSLEDRDMTQKVIDRLKETLSEH